MLDRHAFVEPAAGGLDEGLILALWGGPAAGGRDEGLILAL